MTFNSIFSLLFDYSSYLELFNQLETWLYFLCVVINFKNINLRFLFLLLFLFQLFDAYVLAKQMAVIKPFYLEHFIESLYSLMACFLILGRAKIAGWVSYDSRYLGYMQEFGLFAVYVGFAIYSAVLCVEGVLYWHTDLIPNPLPIFSHRLYVYYFLESVEIFIIVKLTIQNLRGVLPVRHCIDL